MDYLLDLLQGLGIAAAIGIRPVPAHAARRRAGRRRRRRRLRRHGLLFPREAPDSCSRSWSRWPCSASSTAARRRSTRPAGRRGDAARRSRSCSARCWPARSIADASEHWWPGLLVGVGGRRARLRGRALAASPASARAWTPRPPGALPLYAEGDRRCSSAGALDPVPAARDPRRRARSPGCCSAAAAAPARSTPGLRILPCEQEARPRRHRRDEARDARAGGRDGPRADAAAADRARAATSTSASPRSRRSRRSARPRSPPAPARASTRSRR